MQHSIQFNTQQFSWRSGTASVPPHPPSPRTPPVHQRPRSARAPHQRQRTSPQAGIRKGQCTPRQQPPGPLRHAAAEWCLLALPQPVSWASAGACGRDGACQGRDFAYLWTHFLEVPGHVLGPCSSTEYKTVRHGMLQYATLCKAGLMPLLCREAIGVGTSSCHCLYSCQWH